MLCPICNGSLIGDGYTMPMHCENVDISSMTLEPDCDPIYCKPPLKPHPEICPNCGSDIVTYERFTLTRGEYVCDNCGWGMDAVTGEITYTGGGPDDEL